LTVAEGTCSPIFFDSTIPIHKDPLILLGAVCVFPRASEFFFVLCAPTHVSKVPRVVCDSPISTYCSRLFKFLLALPPARKAALLLDDLGLLPVRS